MRVVFVMPNAGSIPIGGFKVVYEYANHLTRRGHTVTVVHSALQRVDTPLPELPRRIAHYWRVRLSGKVGPAGWFGLDPNVSLRWVLRPDDRHVPDADAVIATSWDVAEWVQRYPGTKGNRFYFIQHLESWDGPEDRVLATWRLPLRKIVIARWLQEIGTGQGVDAAYIPNGLDFDAFGVDIEPADRNPLQYAMLFHTSAWKGCADGLAAFSIIRRRFPTTELELFGVADPPANLPAGVTYRKQPSPKELRCALQSLRYLSGTKSYRRMGPDGNRGDGLRRGLGSHRHWRSPGICNSRSNSFMQPCEMSGEAGGQCHSVD